MTANISQQSLSGSNQNDMNQISNVVVNFNVKLAEMREGFNQAVEKLTSRVSELETVLSEKNARMLSQETELAKFKGNCKARLDQASHHLRQCESKSLQFDEKIIKLEHNIKKICKGLKSLKKESAESNHMQAIKVGVRNCRHGQEIQMEKRMICPGPELER